MSKIINELSVLVSKQKLVPFIGAGCSVSMMPDWDSLVNDMRQEVGLTSETDHLLIAQTYVDTFGREKFCEFLKNKLEINEFDDEKGYIHLTIMNMGVPAIYTTNQDNVMEKGYEKYGKKFRIIIEINDFAEVKLSEQLYIKFHGDLNKPESIIFTKEDYEKRIKENENALNIRLRSDLIAKNLFFIGYSFRDNNIQQMFDELNSAFFGRLPKSYMVAYRYSDRLQGLCDNYGITLIDPMKEIPNSSDPDLAFRDFLRLLIENARFKKFEDDLSDFFTSPPNVPRKIISKLEIEILEKTIREKEFRVGINSFREVCDLGVIPQDMENEIVNMFIELAKKVKTDDETQELNAANFNLKLTDPFSKAIIIAVIMSVSNVRQPKSKYGTDHFIITNVNGISERLYSVIAARAIKFVYDWGWEPTPPLVSNIWRWIEQGIDFELMPPNIQNYITGMVDKLNQDCRTVAENPIKRQQRLKEFKFQSDEVLQEEEIELMNAVISS
ncbi:SIR2 family protein [Paenibacillus sp. LjRoot56]|uniref:SIR2 family protein n=1 Tax=Paenibacillus sp. LjRoot56 TaxID=3342333 RepID=UPI003ED16E6D